MIGKFYILSISFSCQLSKIGCSHYITNEVMRLQEVKSFDSQLINGGIRI